MPHLLHRANLLAQKPFIDNHVNIQDIFYFGEILLLPTYRGRHLCRPLLAQCETVAIKQGAKIATFCMIQRPINDPCRPKSFNPLDDICQHFGYQRQNKLCAYFTWQEIGEKMPFPKPLVFWTKKLAYL